MSGGGWRKAHRGRGKAWKLRHDRFCDALRHARRHGFPSPYQPYRCTRTDLPQVRDEAAHWHIGRPRRVMSYSIHLEADTGAGQWPSVYQWDCTSNYAPMWRAAGLNLAEWDAADSGVCEMALRAGLVALRADPERFKPLERGGDRGGFDQMLAKLESLAEAMARHPKTRVSVWH